MTDWITMPKRFAEREAQAVFLGTVEHHAAHYACRYAENGK